MAYSPQVHLGAEAEAALKTRLIFLLTNHRAERGQWIQELRNFQRDYWAASSTTPKKFPFYNASNIIIPLTAITVEAVHARMMSRAFGSDQFVAAKFFDDYWSNFDRPIEKFLDWQIIDQMKFKNKFESALLELLKYGTGVMKDGYTRTVKNVRMDGQDVEYPVYQGPCCEYVPLGNFLMPFVSQDPQTSEWCGEEHTDNQYNVYLQEKSGLFREGTYNKLGGWYGNQARSNLSSDPLRQDAEKDAKQIPTWPTQLGWFELYIPWGGTQDATSITGETSFPVKRELIIGYHFDSNEILFIRDNPNKDGRRPYELGVYQKIEGRWAGMGIAKQQEQFQKEITVQHRQRLDAGTLANANMLKVKKLSDISVDEPVFPGKMWFLNEMDDIESIQLGGTYPAASNNEQQTLFYGQQRSGIHELTQGMQQVGTPGTATGDMARLQESNLKFDYTYSNVKDFADRCIINVVTNIREFGCSDPRYFDLIPEGQDIRAFFSLPSSILRSGIIVKFELRSQSANKMLDRNNWMQLSQIFTQYYQNAIGVAQLTGNPELLMAVALQSVNASTIAFKHILESYDIPNPDKLTLSSLINGLLPALSGGGQNVGGNQQLSPPTGIPVSPPINNPNS